MIGACEWCGIVDHHLVKGLCASCSNNFQDYDPSMKNQETDNALGMEAANVATINGFEKKELNHDSIY